MSKRKNKSNSARNIIVFIIIVLIAIIIGLIVKLNSYKLDDTPITIQKERDSKYVRPTTISLMGQEKFFNKYSGKISQEDILRVLTDFSYYIIDNKVRIDDFSDEDIEKEYNNNNKSFQKMGIENVDDFRGIIKNIHASGKGEADFSYAKCDPYTYSNNGKTSTVDFLLKITNTDLMYFKLEINNSYDKSDCQLKISVK